MYQPFPKDMNWHGQRVKAETWQRTYCFQHFALTFHVYLNIGFAMFCSFSMLGRSEYIACQHTSALLVLILRFVMAAGSIEHAACSMQAGVFSHSLRQTCKDNITRNFGLGFLQFLGEIDYGCQGRLCQTVPSRKLIPVLGTEMY